MVALPKLGWRPRNVRSRMSGMLSPAAVTRSQYIGTGDSAKQDTPVGLLGRWSGSTGDNFKGCHRVAEIAAAIFEKRAASLAIGAWQPGLSTIYDAITPAERQAVADLPPARRDDPDVTEIRWMLEELRVSLFAQTLGTLAPVSENRILAALGHLSA